MDLALSFPHLQFYWRQTDKAGVPLNPVPNFLPFEFEFNNDLQLIKQKMNPLVVETLERVYQEDFNVGYLDDTNSLAKLYGTDFINFMARFISSEKSLKVLEIGCGKGFLLQHLHKLGHKVTGLDPSPSAQQTNPKIKIIADFFPSSKVASGWDVILHYDVLEHAEHAIQFLEAQREILKDDGLLVFAVPDCTNGIEKGDLSIILHEHINYFDLESLDLLLKASGFKALSMERSQNVGTIYCVARRDESSPVHNKSMEKFLSFKSKVENNVAKIKDTLLSAQEYGKTVGFYVPLRFLPYLSLLEMKNHDNLRFFDDSSAFKDKYFDGFAVIIESGENLRKRPVDILLVGSYIFGAKIVEKLSDVKGMKIITIADLFTHKDKDGV